MERSNRKRTTLTPGVVDLPKKRRTSAEVALEKKKKNDMATARTRAKQLAAAQVAELESQMVTAQDKGSSANVLVPERSRKRPATSASRDVSFCPITDQISLLPMAKPRAQTLAALTPVKTLPNGRGKKRKADEQPTATATKRKGGPRYATKRSRVQFHAADSTHTGPLP
jgi:hypothetical protein